MCSFLSFEFVLLRKYPSVNQKRGDWRPSCDEQGPLQPRQKLGRVSTHRARPLGSGLCSCFTAVLSCSSERINDCKRYFLTGSLRLSGKKLNGTVAPQAKCQFVKIR